jgi:hypothetical protein
MPAYSWTQSTTGKVELTDQALGENDSFFENLVLNTDNGMKQYIITTYSVTLTW